MSGIGAFMQQPTPGAVVRRNITVSGQFTRMNGSINSVTIQFGVGGPVFNLTAHIFSFFWQGNIPSNIRPGQTFQIIVSADGFQPGPPLAPGEPGDPIPVSGQAIQTVTLENVVPSLTVAPFQPTRVATQVPVTNFLISGNAFEGGGAPYGIVSCVYQVGSLPAGNIPLDASGNFTNFALPPLAPGSYPLSISASDSFASTASVQSTITIYKYQPPTPPNPSTKRTAAGLPTSSSVTTYTRLEPQTSNADIGVSSNARVYDPLWLMTRQWQVGEFQGEDTGSPIQTRLRATNAPLSRCLFGEPSGTNTVAHPYDPTRAPLEAMVERRRMRPADDTDARMLTLSVEAGLHFLRMVELNATTKKYRAAFLSAYVLQQPASQPPVPDDNATRFVQTMVGRAPDARRLAMAFRPTAPTITFDPALAITAADLVAMQGVAMKWLTWYDTLFAEPVAPTDDAWTATRLEYAVSVGARLSATPADSLTLSASEFDGGRLDWSSFDVNSVSPLNTTGDHTFVPLNETTIPTPVTFGGAPAARFWELEDAKIAYGLLPAGPTDLAHLMMAEYSSSYGNDWFVMPVKTPVGSVTRVDSLIVTDTFGVKSLVRPIGDPALTSPYFSMWQQSAWRPAGGALGVPVPNRFFFPPSINRTVDSAPIEDVLFMRDEMANVAWGIERSIEGAIEGAVPLTTGVASTSVAPVPVPPPAAGVPPMYQLSTDVPDNWIPLLPFEQQVGSALVSRLRRGAVLQPNATSVLQQALSETLKVLGTQMLYDEEVPREGVRITRRRRMTRWVDGSSWVWTAFRNEVGRGEGSAGLVFDSLEGDGQV
ncbi:MAG: hypothetical protein ABJE10_01005 [bacterium]